MPLAVPLPLSGRAIGAVGMWFPDGPPDLATTAAPRSSPSPASARRRSTGRGCTRPSTRSPTSCSAACSRPACRRWPGSPVAARTPPGARQHAPSGGDWYDLLPVDDTAVALVVGDVVGHGPPAAAVMGQLRSALAAQLLDGRSPAAALERLDRFAARVAGSTGSTCACLLLRLVDRRAALGAGRASAGAAGRRPAARASWRRTPAAGRCSACAAARPTAEAQRGGRAGTLDRCSTPTGSSSVAASFSTRAWTGWRRRPSASPGWAPPSSSRRSPRPRSAMRARPTTSRCWSCAPFPRRSPGGCPPAAQSMRVLRRLVADWERGRSGCPPSSPRTWSSPSARPPRTPRSTLTRGRGASSSTPSRCARTAASRSRSRDHGRWRPVPVDTVIAGTGCA